MAALVRDTCRMVEPLAAPRGTRWGVAEEVPVEIGFNGSAWTVMMATPADVEDLAAGLALTEGAIRSGQDIERVEIRDWPEGISADIRIDPSHLQDERISRRALDGRTGCGLCGIETLADLHQPVRTDAGRITIEADAIARALSALPDHQPLNKATHSVHAAAWCAPDGNIKTAREDVGRHNALDKLAGALLRRGEIAAPGFVVMSSRCSFELVFKAARLGASALATVSAPTGRALDLAAALDLPLASLGPEQQVVRFGEPAHE